MACVDDWGGYDLIGFFHELNPDSSTSEIIIDGIKNLGSKLESTARIQTDRVGCSIIIVIIGGQTEN